MSWLQVFAGEAHGDKQHEASHCDTPATPSLTGHALVTHASHHKLNPNNHDGTRGEILSIRVHIAQQLVWLLLLKEKRS